jgi:hypothetical protein
MPAGSAQASTGRPSGWAAPMAAWVAVRMTSDAGLIEHQQPPGTIPTGQARDVCGQLGGRYLGEVAVGIIQQGHGADAAPASAACTARCGASSGLCRRSRALAWASRYAV